MSTWPEHEENIMNLKSMGFDVSDAIEDGKVTMESYDYDELVYLLSEVIAELKNQDFKVGSKQP